MSRGSSDLSLRTSGRRAGLADDARRLVNDVFGTNSVGRVTTLAEQVDASIVPERLLATLAGFFGAVGALLAAIGLFGLLAYTVAAKRRGSAFDGSRRHPGSREPHGGDERGLVGQRGIPSRRADGVLEYTIRRAQRRELRMAGRCPLPRLRRP